MPRVPLPLVSGWSSSALECGSDNASIIKRTHPWKSSSLGRLRPPGTPWTGRSLPIWTAHAVSISISAMRCRFRMHVCLDHEVQHSYQGTTLCSGPVRSSPSTFYWESTCVSPGEDSRERSFCQLSRGRSVCQLPLPWWFWPIPRIHPANGLLGERSIGLDRSGGTLALSGRFLVLGRKSPLTSAPPEDGCVVHQSKPIFLLRVGNSVWHFLC